MPSSLPLPKVSQLRQASQRAAQSADIYADVHDGSILDHAMGPMAVLFARQADRDKSLFEDVYFDSAQGYALSKRGLQIYKVARILDTFGTGTCVVQRPSAAAGGNTFYQGTRIQVAGTPPSYYQVASDTPYGALALSIPLPVQAMVVGAGTAIQTSSGLSFEDPIEDPTFVPVQLTCADGTNFEKASDYRARCRSTAQNATVGYVPAVVLACQAAGARYVVAFASNYGLSANAFDNSNLFLNDLGLNALYVGDANYQSAPSLIQSCYAAVEGVRVLGADLWIGGFTSVPITLNVLVTLTASPSNLPVVSIRKDIVQAAIGAFGSTTGGYLFKIQALVGAMKNANAFVQTASLASSWSPNTQYGQGNVVVPTPLNGSTYQCTTQGQSGAVQPSFPGIPGTTVGDGGVTWTCTNYPQVGLFAGGVLQTSDPTLSPNAWPNTLRRYVLEGTGITVNFTGPI